MEQNFLDMFSELTPHFYQDVLPMLFLKCKSLPSFSISFLAVEWWASEYDRTQYDCPPVRCLGIDFVCKDCNRYSFSPWMITRWRPLWSLELLSRFWENCCKKSLIIIFIIIRHCVIHFVYVLLEKDVILSLFKLSDNGCFWKRIK